MSSQRSFKIESIRFDAFVPKKIEYIHFRNKILERNKIFPSVLEKFGPKAFVLVDFQIFFEQVNVLFCLLKTLTQFKTFWFRFDIIFCK
jgi:hypothetical protein